MKTHKHITFLFLVVFFTSQIACKNSNSNTTEKEGGITSFFTPDKFNIEEVASHLQAKFDSNKPIEYLTFWDKIDSNSQFFNQFYKSNLFQPVWINEDGLSLKCKQYMLTLDSLQYDALNPEDYFYSYLQEKCKHIENEKNIDSLVQFELLMTKSFFEASHDLVVGKKYKKGENENWKNNNDTLYNQAIILKASLEKENMSVAFELMRPNHVWYKKFKEEYIHLLQNTHAISFAGINDLKDSITIGFNSPSVALLRKKLHHEVSIPHDTISTVWNEEVLEALKKYQFKNQLKQTGKLDTSTLKILSTNSNDKLKKIALNMERLRWLRHDFKQPYIWVNIPKMELDYYDKDTVQFNMRVVVGRTSRMTPTLDAKIESIVFSPPWSVPPTIMKEEVVPGIARRGGSYLARRGLKAYRGGRLVNPAMINAKNFKSFTISQAPGYRSSLGEVKFNMPNPWAIYLHDTPHREDFVKSYRAYSSGCIRVHKPKQFAEFLLQDTNKYSYSKIDSICKKRTTIFTPVKRNINVHIVYLTNAIDSVGNIMYLKDIYGWDKN